MSGNAEHIEKIQKYGKSLDYEQEAIDGVRRSWEHDDPVCQQLALADAQVWATLHLARVTQAGMHLR